MTRNLVFVGGIHGVGKSTFCQKLSELTEYAHYTASQLIKSQKSSAINSAGKEVKNIDDNQQLLIQAIATLEENDIILDGHFSVLNQAGRPETIETEVFAKIRPTVLAALYDDPKAIFERRKKRDSKEYPLEQTEAHQTVELNHAIIISRELDIDLIKGKPDGLTLEKLALLIRE